MQRLLLVFAWLISSTVTANAQISQAPVNIPSPNVSSLGQYGEVPVSLFTGVPNISIPLHTAQEGKLNVPVTLNYHASGFRPDVHPGWVGAGWSLNAGGVVTRSINDMPDDYNPPVQTTMYYAQAGYYFTASQVFTNRNPFDPNNLANNIFSNSSAGFLRDTEPDIFSFSFAGYSGRFYQGVDGKWKADSDKPIRITLTTDIATAPDGFRTVPFTAARGSIFDNSAYPNSSAFSKTFNGFTITIEDGTQYIFGNTTDAIEYSVGLLTQRKGSEDLTRNIPGVDCSWIADSWYLTKIIHPDGHQITLSYSNERANRIYVCQMTNSVYVNLGTSTSGGGSVCSTGSSQRWPPATYNNGRLVSPVYLETIKTTNTTTRFVTSRSTELRYDVTSVFYPMFQYWCLVNNPSNVNSAPSLECFFPYLQQNSPISPSAEFDDDFPRCLDNLQWRKLSSVQIERSNGQPLRSYNLTFSNSNNERLSLKEVQEVGSDGSDKPAYKFNYYPLAQAVPYLARTVDHWGFYNNIDNFAGVSSPLSYSNLSPFENNRRPTQNLATAISNVLSKITYPTGGVTEFEYQQHRYAKTLTKNRAQCVNASSNQEYAGGIRIGIIRSYSLDKPQQKTEKRYYYVRGYNNQVTNPEQLPSSGVLGGQFQYLYTYQAKGVTTNFLSQAAALVGSILGLQNPPGSSIDFVEQAFSSQSVLPACSNSQGTHVGYSVVVEKNSDGSYTKYYYSNFDPNYSDAAQSTFDGGHLDDLTPLTLRPGNNANIFTPYEPHSSREVERGNLLQEESYASKGTIVRMRNTIYSTVNKGPGYDIPAIKARAFYLCDVNPSMGLPPLAPEATCYYFYTYSYLPQTVTETVYDAAGLQPVTTTKQYSYNIYKQLAQESTTNSQGQTLLTQFTYPGSYTYAGTPPTSSVAGTMAAMALTSATGKHMLAYPVETRTYRDGKIVSATVQTYSSEYSANATPQPYQSLRLTADRPLASYQPLQFTGGANPTRDPNLQLQATFNAYDDIGNIVMWTRTDDASMSYQWGYGKYYPVATFANASRITVDSSSPALGNEASYLGFESGASASQNTDEDYWDNVTDATRNELSNTDAHTGNYSWLVGAAARPGDFNYGPGRTFSPERQNLRYKLSAWVKTGPGYNPGDARFVISVNHALNVQGGAYLGVSTAYQAESAGSTNGQWRYYEVIIDLQAAHNQTGIPSSAERFRVAAYTYNAGRGSYQIDDLRFHPVDSQVSTHTFDTAIGQPTSSSSFDSRPTYSLYDAFQRLYMMKDHAGNIVKHYEYHYQR